MSNKFKEIDLFYGAGGLSICFCQREISEYFENILALDNAAAAIKTYNTNSNSHSVQANIEEWIASNEVPPADIVIGGPPCQGFSLLRIGIPMGALHEHHSAFRRLHVRDGKCPRPAEKR